MTSSKLELEITKLIVESGALSLRDVDNGEEPFIYSSGSRGPGYVMIKGLVSQPTILRYLISKLAEKINEVVSTNFDIINGNATGGMVPGWELRNQLSAIQKREIPFLYLRGSRKEGGHNELITGDLNSPNVKKNMKILSFEELVNYGQTTNNAVQVYRESGYNVDYAACILDYGLPETDERIKQNKIKLISLISLPKVLYVAEQHKLLPPDVVRSYLNFLEDPLYWQISRNMVIPEISVLQGIDRGYKFVKLTSKQSLELDAPFSKVKDGTVYYKYTGERNPFLFIALDFDNQKTIYEVAEKLAVCQEENFGFKINLDSVIDFGSGDDISTFLSKMKQLGKPIFLDLKMWNGVRTMSNIVKKCVELGVDIINVYCHAGTEALRSLKDIVNGSNTKLFGVTVLTHYDDEYCNEIYGKTIEQSVYDLVKIAVDVELDGVILPSTQLKSVDCFNILKMCPGIRPEWIKSDERGSNNQKQIMTPKEAVYAGADYIVVGTPITKVSDDKNMIDRLKHVLDSIDF